MIAVAATVGLILGLSAITVPGDKLTISVVLYILIPIAIS
ncbi:bile acid:sodium symporter [Rhizobium grahamii CCGE 502]|uniref:Bile acid:sodium symporter n=1 Tax=Rhizobium grahamii CCGE 502 TaxID=990285 RepID=S3HBX5_9HYPH|nr:bile acid:sodium symporter [Rhizobium grahamii CCGE 502]